MIDTDALAARLDEAARDAAPVPQLSASEDFDLAQAYAIQDALIARRLARGEQVIGLKMGFTSQAKALQMGVKELIYGWLTNAMNVECGGVVDLARYCHARAEPELAFRLARPLSGEVGEDEAYAAVEAVAPAIELIDSRYRDFKFSLVDVVADNASSSGVVIGPWQQKPADPSKLAVSLLFDGQPVQRGSTSDVMGDPILSLVTAARMLAPHGRELEAGWIVMTGGATAAAPLPAGAEIASEVEGLGRAHFHTAPRP